MTEHVYPALFALVIWWFSTGLIMYLDGLPKRTFRWSMLGATLVVLVALWGLGDTAGDATLIGAYLAFTCGLLVWGWLQISFYMGYITGTRRQPCQEGCSGWRHFGHAIQTGIWHELATIVAAITIMGLTWGGVNQIGLWTFMVLWWMHLSAKLNVFFGVRNLNEEFLPEHLDFLKSYLTKKSMNLFFPVSVTISTAIAVMLGQAALASQALPFEAAGYSFLTMMMALAILEHWFLILPIPAAILWQWGLASRPSKKMVEVDVITGFLGAGKTAFLQQTLAKSTKAEKVVVLVNDFSLFGLDDTLAGDQTADVIELPNGCLCCSLQADLASQLSEIVTRFAPDRVLIEPAGLANIAALLGIFKRPELKRLIRGLRVYAVIDGSTFLKDLARLEGYFRTQASLAPVLIVNKIDLMTNSDFETIHATLRSMTQEAIIIPATHGAVSVPGLSERAMTNLDRGLRTRDNVRDDHRHYGSDLKAALGLTSWSTALAGSCDAQRLRPLLEKIAAGDFGKVDRVKGIALTGGGWVQFGVAGGRATLSAFAARDDETPRVVAIGASVDESGLLAAFQTCGAITEPTLA